MVKKILPLSAQNFSLHDTKDGQHKIKKQLTLKLKIVLSTILILSVLVIVVVCVCLFAHEPPNLWFPSGDSSSKLGVYQKAAVSTDAAPCAPIGREMLEKNGSAVDSAIAMLLCMGLINPQSQGLGGGFLMTLYKRETGEVFSIDAREVAPLDATEDMFEGDANKTKIGGLAMAVPGELAGYAAAHERFGSLPWADLFQPVIRMSREGVPVSPHLALQLKKFSKFIYERELFKKYFVNNETGKLLDVGDTLYRPDLAETFEAIARDGRRALYDPENPLAKKFHTELRNMGSIIKPEDFEKYEVRITDPITVKIRDNMTVHSSPIPGSGALLAFMLNILDGYNITSEVTKTKEHATLTLHHMIEAFKFAYAKRMYLEDDEEGMKPLMENMTSREYGRQIQSQINDSTTFSDPIHYGLGEEAMFAEDHGTSHASIIAPNGDAVSVTSTINIYFGSFEMSESTGIILNNEMDDFSNPNVVSYFGVPPSVHNMIKPGRRPMSSMCPTLVVDSKQNARLSIGANGGTKITTAVLQVLLRNLWMDESIKSAIDAPRFHHQLLPDKMLYEKDFPQAALDALKVKGHTEERFHGMMSIVLGIARGTDGRLYGNSDYRKGGEVDGF